MAFEAALQRWSGPSAWVFVPVPEDHAPRTAGPFGRIPVIATVDGHTWKTSVWRDKSAGWLLPVPANVRRGKDDGDLVLVELDVDPLRIWASRLTPRRILVGYAAAPGIGVARSRETGGTG